MAKKKSEEDIEQRVALPTAFYPWHKKQQHFLLEQKQKKRLAHALLLTGSRHLGKFDFACAFAALLLCEQHSQDCEQACGDCHACCLLKNLTHPDFFLVEPEKENAAIGIDAIRKLGESITKTAQRNGKRVVIIAPAENMTDEAANALLKRLEEPGADLHFLLVSHASDALLATIRSRCQKLLFSVPLNQDVLPWLELRVADTGVAASVLLEDASGAPLLAFANANDPLYQEKQNILLSLMALLKGEVFVSLLLRQWGSYNLITLLNWWSAWLLDISKLHAGAEHRFLKHQSACALIEDFAGMLVAEDLLAFIDVLNEMNAKLQAAVPVNKEILLESLLIKWSLLAKKI